MRLVSDFYIAAHFVAQSPWNGRLYESQEEAINDLKTSPHKDQLYIINI
jgi:hypothetical protein